MIKKHNLFKSRRRLVKAHTVVLHHTGGGNLKGAEDTLVKKGLGYHYMIDPEGIVVEYGTPDVRLSHSYKRNTGTVGVAYVGGGKFGAINELQLEALIRLMRYIRVNYGVTNFTGHKHIDPRGWKIDPRWPGEPHNGIDWGIDKERMEYIQLRTKLKAVYRERTEGKY